MGTNGSGIAENVLILKVGVAADLGLIHKGQGISASSYTERPEKKIQFLLPWELL